MNRERARCPIRSVVREFRWHARLRRVKAVRGPIAATRGQDNCDPAIKPGLVPVFLSPLPTHSIFALLPIAAGELIGC